MMSVNCRRLSHVFHRSVLVLTRSSRKTEAASSTTTTTRQTHRHVMTSLSTNQHQRITGGIRLQRTVDGESSVVIFINSAMSFPRWTRTRRKTRNVPSPTGKPYAHGFRSMPERSMDGNSKGSSPTEFDHEKAKLKELFSIPNIITLTRIFASPALAYAIAYDMKLAALGGCIIAGLSDWLDGYIAKTFDMKTVLGAFLDPVADKAVIAAVTLGLTLKGLFPVPLAAVIVGRDVVLIAASFILRALEKPPGAAFFDTTHSATFKISPSEFSKANTGIQFGVLTLCLSRFCFEAPSVEFIEPFYWIAAVTTVGSGLGYLDGTGVTRLSNAEEEQPPDSSSTQKVEHPKNGADRDH